MTTTVNDDGLAAILAVHPRAYSIRNGRMHERIARRIAVSLARESGPEATHLLDLLLSGTRMTLWADDVTAPALTLTEHHADGGATLWRVRPDAAGVVYIDGRYHYWPDPALDDDIPNMPITLGTDDWCLNF